MSGDDSRDLLTTLSAVALAAGLLVSAALLAIWGEVIVMFVLAGVLPALLGYAGLARAGALPWRTTTSDDEEDLVEELKRRYARGELDDAEMERKIETLLAADEADSRSGDRILESELGRGRR